MQPLKDPVSDPAAASAAVNVTERATLAPWRCVAAVSHATSLRICGQSHGDFLQIEYSDCVADKSVVVAATVRQT